MEVPSIDRRGRNANCRLWFTGTARASSGCRDVLMKKNDMTNQNQPGRHNRRASRVRAPGKRGKNPNVLKEKTSDADA
jgi:hypothetical protein